MFHPVKLPLRFGETTGFAAAVTRMTAAQRGKGPARSRFAVLGWISGARGAMSAGLGRAAIHSGSP